jgi:IS30 family transposase
VAAINGFDPQPHIFLRDINILILSRKRASYAAGKCVPQAIECPALGQHVRELPVELGRSLTWDRGTEMARHKDFTLATDMQVFFCDPHSPWQRGTNENTNGLLRQYLPKGEDLSEYSQQRLNEIAMRLNQRPRQTLGFSTPAEVLSSSVALTG